MNSFKGCLSALEATDIVSEAISHLDKRIEVDKIPLVDGGTGSLEAWSHILQLKTTKVWTVDPLNRPIQASLLINGQTAYIEMALASGLHLLLPDEYNVLQATSYGTGLLIKEAISKGCKHIYLGLGGSATHDLGTGILQALGVVFLDTDYNVLHTPEELINFKYIDDSGIKELSDDIKFTLLCDVNNPLLGPLGAANVFAPQKGAKSEKLILSCEELSKRFASYFNERHMIVGDKPGDGAAGGIPALLRVFCNAEIASGVLFTADISELPSKLAKSDLVITGEGSFDEQSFYGKGPGTIIDLCQGAQTPVLILTGGYKNIDIAGLKKTSIFSLLPHPATLEESMANVRIWLYQTALNAIRLAHSMY